DDGLGTTSFERRRLPHQRDVSRTARGARVAVDRPAHLAVERDVEGHELRRPGAAHGLNRHGGEAHDRRVPLERDAAARLDDRDGERLADEAREVAADARLDAVVEVQDIAIRVRRLLLATAAPTARA